jgi:hypothetical protein
MDKASPIGGITPQDCNARIRSLEQRMRALDTALAEARHELPRVQQDMYDHQSMKRACANDLRRTLGYTRTCAVGGGAATLLAVGLGVSGFLTGSFLLGVLAIPVALGAAQQLHTLKRAEAAAPQIRSMQAVVEKCIADTERQEKEIEERIEAAARERKEAQSQIDLLQMAGRVATAPQAGETITRGSENVKIGKVTVPRREA